MRGIGTVVSAVIIALLAGAALSYLALPPKVEVVTETETRSITETVTETTTEITTETTSETTTETASETIFITTTTTVLPSTTPETTTATFTTEHVAVVSAYVEFDGNDFRIIIVVKNTGSVNATLDHCYIDGNRWNVFGATSCTVEGRTIGGPGRPTYTLTPGQVATVTIEIPAGVVIGAQTLDVSLRTVSGGMFPVRVALP